MKNFSEFAKDGLYRAKQLGAQQAEVFLIQHRHTEWELHCPTKEIVRLETMEQAEQQGVGFRVIKNGKMGFAFSSDLSQTAIAQMIHQAVINSGYSDQDNDLYFPNPSITYNRQMLYDETYRHISQEEKQALMQDVAKEAFAFDNRVKKVEKVGYEEGEIEVQLANSEGILLEEQSGYCGLYCLAMSESDNGYGMDSAIAYGLLSAKKVGEMAGKRAVQLIGATSVPSQVADLVLDPYVAVQLFGIISNCFSGESVRKGKSFLAGRLQQTVAGEAVTIVDDGLLPMHMGSATFDGEGVATQRTVLVKNGILQTYLYDSLSAKKAGVESTGNSMRRSYQGMPYIGTTNYYLQQGNLTVDALLHTVSNGFYVTEILGAHTANPISGDFSFGASGIWIRDGKKTVPVRGVTIAGNLQDVLKSISCVANDLTFYGAKGSPTVKIDGIAISGH